jgi:hypothetical protein
MSTEYSGYVGYGFYANYSADSFNILKEFYEEITGNEYLLNKDPDWAHWYVEALDFGLPVQVSVEKDGENRIILVLADKHSWFDTTLVGARHVRTPDAENPSRKLVDDLAKKMDVEAGIIMYATYE